MSTNKVTRIYSGFRGVDFRGEEINLSRSPDSLNMWKDYKEIDSIRTRPALKKMELTELANTQDVKGIFFYTVKGKKRMIVQRGTTVFEYFMDGSYPQAIGYNFGENIGSFVYDDVLYYKDGKGYYQYDGNEFKQVESYVPTTTIGKAPSGGGTVLEDVNLLTGRRINTFCGDGKSTEYKLDAENIDGENVFVIVVKVNGVVLPKIDMSTTTDNYIVDFDKGTVTFKTAPSEPLTDGQDNVSIEFSKTIEGYRDKIDKCTLLEVFDNRVFFSGNPDYPNYVWHSSLDNPAYCSDLDYYVEGLDTARVTGLVAGNNALWVFREPSPSNTSIYYHTPTIDGEYGKVYPNVHSNISLGCVGGAINFNDDIVFFSQRGMEGVHGDVTTEQAVAHRSSLVDRKLLVEEDYKNMILVEWEGYLLCFIGNKVYLADSRATFANENHFEYEWFYWELEHKVTCATVSDGVLYIGTAAGTGTSGIYTLTDLESAVESYWVTPKDKFKYPQRMKTTNKRGCVVEATGDVTVYAKTEKHEGFTDGADDTDNTLIKSYKDIGDYAVSRIKRKKFKDIQLKFHSNTRFSLESVSLECYIGGYIKR